MEEVIEKEIKTKIQRLLTPSKTKDVFCYVAIVLSLFISIFCTPFIWITMLIIICSGIYLKDVQKIIQLLVFTFVFNSLFCGYFTRLEDYSTMRFVLVVELCVLYGIDVYRKKKQINLKLLVPIIFYLAYIFYPVHWTHIYNLIKYAIVYMLFFIIYEYRKELDLKNIILSLVYGLLIGSCFVLFLNWSTKLQGIVSTDVIRNCWRFSGIFNHPNQFAIYVSVGLSSLLFLFYHNQLSKITFFVLYLSLFTLGYLTLSRQFILSAGLGIFVFLLLYLIRYKKKSIKTILSFCLSLVIVVGVCFVQTKVYLVRFKILDATKIEFVEFKPAVLDYQKFDKGQAPSDPDDYEDWWSQVYAGEITYDPGRSELRQEYIDDIFASPNNFLFGRGIDAPRIGNMNAHNFFITEMWMYGLFGIAFYIVFILTAINYTKLKKLKQAASWLILFVPFLALALIESMVQIYVPFIIYVLALMQLTEDNNKLEGFNMKQQKYDNNRIKDKFKFVKIKDIMSGFVMLLAFIPAMIAKIFIRDFWLICEDKNEARDNGYWLFKHIREKYPKQKVAYAINKKSVDYNKVKDLGKVIQYGGFSHWFWYFVADKNISSQKGGKPNAAICYVLEVVLKSRKKNRIFLQHGIIASDLKWLYYKNTTMHRFVVSTKQEYDFLTQNFGYPEGNIVLTGLCRFDNLLNSKVDENQILLMPTWRQWIARDVEMKKIEGTTNFVESNYFKAYDSLLKNEKLDNLLKKYNKKLIFYPHRNMQKYIDKFSTTSDNITIANAKDYDVQQLLKESALLLTDYSSIFFDFAYMKKPIIFYQFDEKAFREYQYKEGYFDYKNNELSVWTDNQNDLLKEVEKVIKNNMKKSDVDAADKVFKYNDSNNCERTYQMIKES